MTNQSRVVSQASNFKAILTTVIAILLAVSIFTTTAVAGTDDRYDVTIIDNGEEITITTNETEPIEILNQANFTLDEDDKLDITAFTQGEGGTIVINRLNTINVDYGSQINTYSVYALTVGDALKELGIVVNENDAINYNLTDKVEDGMVIKIDPAYSIPLTVDGQTTNYALVNGTVQDLLNLAGVVLGSEDYTVPSLDTPICEGLCVEVFRVKTVVETVQEEIGYSTKEIQDQEMYVGERVTQTNGVNGKARVTYSVKYVNGVATDSVKTSSYTLSEPVEAVVKVGTKRKGNVASNGVTSMNGFTVGQKISGRYSHYCVCKKCCGKENGVTASGAIIRNGMAEPYYVACNWLPLGTVINVNGQNYTVADRGGKGLSKVGRIDIFTPGGHQAAISAGVGNCSIEIVRLGW